MAANRWRGHVPRVATSTIVLSGWIALVFVTDSTALALSVEDIPTYPGATLRQSVVRSKEHLEAEFWLLLPEDANHEQVVKPGGDGSLRAGCGCCGFGHVASVRAKRLPISRSDQKCSGRFARGWSLLVRLRGGDNEYQEILGLHFGGVGLEPALRIM